MSDEEFEAQLKELEESLRCLRRIKDKSQKVFFRQYIRRVFQSLTRD